MKSAFTVRGQIGAANFVAKFSSWLQPRSDQFSNGTTWGSRRTTQGKMTTSTTKFQQRNAENPFTSIFTLECRKYNLSGGKSFAQVEGGNATVCLVPKRYRPGSLNSHINAMQPIGLCTVQGCRDGRRYHLPLKCCLRSRYSSNSSCQSVKSEM